MNTVFELFYDDGYDEHDHYGIFSSKENAELITKVFNLDSRTKVRESTIDKYVDEINLGLLPFSFIMFLDGELHQVIQPSIKNFGNPEKLEWNNYDRWRMMKEPDKYLLDKILNRTFLEFFTTVNVFAYNQEDAILKAKQLVKQDQEKYPLDTLLYTFCGLINTNTKEIAIEYTFDWFNLPEIESYMYNFKRIWVKAYNKIDAIRKIHKMI